LYVQFHHIVSPYAHDGKDLSSLEGRRTNEAKG